MRLAALVLMLVPLQTQADPIDYAAVFAAHEVEVLAGDQIDGRAIEILTLPDGIELRRLTGPNGEVTYTGIDASGRGAVGCLYNLFFELHALARTCEWTPPKRAAKVLESRLRRITRFVMANAVPPMEADTVNGYLAAQLDLWQAGPGREACGAPDHGLQGFAAALSSDGFEQALDTALAVPRLPVTNPCL